MARKRKQPKMEPKLDLYIDPATRVAHTKAPDVPPFVQTADVTYLSPDTATVEITFTVPKDTPLAGLRITHGTGPLNERVFVIDEALEIIVRDRQGHGVAYDPKKLQHVTVKPDQGVHAKWLDHRTQHDDPTKETVLVVFGVENVENELGSDCRPSVTQHSMPVNLRREDRVPHVLEFVWLAMPVGREHHVRLAHPAGCGCFIHPCENGASFDVGREYFPSETLSRHDPWPSNHWVDLTAEWLEDGDVDLHYECREDCPGCAEVEARNVDVSGVMTDLGKAFGKVGADLGAVLTPGITAWGDAVKSNPSLDIKKLQDAFYKAASSRRDLVVLPPMSPQFDITLPPDPKPGDLFVSPNMKFKFDGSHWEAFNEPNAPDFNGSHPYFQIVDELDPDKIKWSGDVS